MCPSHLRIPEDAKQSLLETLWSVEITRLSREEVRDLIMMTMMIMMIMIMRRRLKRRSWKIEIVRGGKEKEQVEVDDGNENGYNVQP